MIVALLNQKGGVGKTTLALHLAGQWAREGRRVTVIDADPQGSALDWSAQRAREGLPRLFGVIGLARDTLHHEAPALAQGADHVVIDGPPRVAALLRSALLAADLVLIPAQPSPFDGWASAEMLRLLEEARLFVPACWPASCSTAAPRARSSPARPGWRSPGMNRRHCWHGSASGSLSPMLRVPAAWCAIFVRRGLPPVKSPP